MNIKEVVFLASFDVTSDEIKENGGLGGIMYAAAWESSPDGFSKLVKHWLAQSGIEIVEIEEIFIWEDFVKSEHFGSEQNWSELKQALFVDNYEIWFGGIHVYENMDH
jgi:hypothetical protein